jgi:hypothetical protein
MKGSTHVGKKAVLNGKFQHKPQGVPVGGMNGGG